MQEIVPYQTLLCYFFWFLLQPDCARVDWCGWHGDGWPTTLSNFWVIGWSNFIKPWGWAVQKWPMGWTKLQLVSTCWAQWSGSQTNTSPTPALEQSLKSQLWKRKKSWWATRWICPLDPFCFRSCNFCITSTLACLQVLADCVIILK